MTINCTILAKEKMHDAWIYSAYMQIGNKKKPGAFTWRIITLELFVEIYAAGSFVKDPATNGNKELYHTAM